ncbi:MAG: OmpA family protein [Bacteroidetes bacterium]|nr:OmpA family protein [Bacteroidota bacterium]
MFKYKIIASICLLVLLSKAQIMIKGHCVINNAPLTNVQIIINNGTVNTKTISTKSSSEFNLKLDIGNNYKIVLLHQNSPEMFFEVITKNIPDNVKEYKMGYEFDAPFYLKNDNNLNTEVFKDPFNKIIFNGKDGMIDDSLYNSIFLQKIYKSTNSSNNNTSEKNETKQEIPVLLAGKLCINNNPKLSINNTLVRLYTSFNKLLLETSTNRYGVFSFTNVKLSEVDKISVELKQQEIGNNSIISLLNTELKLVSSVKSINNVAEFKPLDEKNALVNNAFTSNIGGKLILISAAQKKFISGKTVYLANKNNTIIKRINTSSFGSFVFENIKPNTTYFIGVDENEAGGGEKIELYNKDDKYIGNLDSIAAKRKLIKINSNYNQTFNALSIADDEMKMNIKAKIYGDNINNPIIKIKILLLNKDYKIVDSTITDDFGTITFKQLPFLKQFYLSAENSQNNLDAFSNILVYNNDGNLVKVLLHEKGKRFNYKPLESEITRLREVEIDDPWLSFVGSDKKTHKENTTIIESIYFETNKFDLTAQAKQILDKVVVVLNTNKKLKIELSAHTDSKGNDADNLKLSQLRAKSATDYICSFGIERDRIISVGYGETKLLNRCGNNVNCSEIEHAQNRRVEFKILEE